jgi:type II secretory pathway pseudopilin PulG
MSDTAEQLASQAIEKVNELKELAINADAALSDAQSQIEGYFNQVGELESKVDDLENRSEVYRNEILTDSEMIGLAIEIMDKIKSKNDSGVFTMPIDEQNQLNETLMYLKQRKQSIEQYRTATDPKPRTYEQYRNP